MGKHLSLYFNLAINICLEGLIVGRIQNETTAPLQPSLAQCSPVSISSASSSSSSSSSSSYLSSDSTCLNRSHSTSTLATTARPDAEAPAGTKQHKSSFSPSGFHRVLNRLVDKSKSLGSENNVSHVGGKFEVIDGYGDMQNLPPKASSKPSKKRSYSYKSNSLTRLGRQHLFKINELDKDRPIKKDKENEKGSEKEKGKERDKERDTEVVKHASFSVDSNKKQAHQERLISVPLAIQPTETVHIPKVCHK